MRLHCQACGLIAIRRPAAAAPRALLWRSSVPTGKQQECWAVCNVKFHPFSTGTHDKLHSSDVDLQTPTRPQHNALLERIPGLLEMIRRQVGPCLTEYTDVQGHCAQAAQDPGQRRPQVVPAVCAQQDAQPVRDVGTYGTPKHGKTEALSAPPADVFADLGHT